MTHQDKFIAWLEGFLDASPDGLTKAQVDTIRSKMEEPVCMPDLGLVTTPNITVNPGGGTLSTPNVTLPPNHLGTPVPPWTSDPYWYPNTTFSTHTDNGLKLNVTGEVKS